MNSRRLAAYLQVQSNQIQKSARDVIARGNRGAVHDMRVAVRRSRAVLTLVTGNSKGLDHQLRRIAKALGSVREIDIAKRDAKSYGLKIKALNSKRKKRAKKAQRQIKKLRKKYAKALTRTEHMLTRDPVFPNKSVENLVDQLKHWQRRVPKTSDALHNLRKTIKVSRYTLEALGQAAPPLEKLQDVLGRAHDLKVLETLAGRQRHLHRDLKRYQREGRRLARPAIAYALKHLANRSPSIDS